MRSGTGYISPAILFWSNMLHKYILLSELIGLFSLMQLWLSKDFRKYAGSWILMGLAYAGILTCFWPILLMGWSNEFVNNKLIPFFEECE